MKVLDLHCAAQHAFEGWFASDEDFLSQGERGLVACPLCDDKAIASAIIGLACSLGLRTIAEGVETPGQLAWLRLQGGDEAQGYFFSPPISPPDLVAWVANQGLRPSLATKNLAG